MKHCERKSNAFVVLSLVLGDVECIGLMICVFYLEEVVNVILGSAILHTGVGVLPHHVIDGVHDICHLLDRQKGGKEIGRNQASPRAADTKKDTALMQRQSERERMVQVPLW